MIAVRKHGLDASEEEVNARMGGSKVEVFRYFVKRQYGAGNEERVDAVYNSFKLALEEGYRKNGVKAIAGVEKTFAELRSRGIKIATTTGFYRKVTEIILKSLGWDEKMLDVSICADDVPAGRPAPYMIFKAMEAAGVQDVNKVIKLGDTPFDMLAGSRAGLRGVIGVLSGSHTAVSLGSVRHTHIIESVADLPALLDREFVK
jgi:phosphonatase-like hydrolase